MVSVYEEKSNPFLVYVLSLFAVFNPFVYDRVMYGQFNVVVSFGLFLLLIGCFLSYTRTQQQKTLLSASVAAGFAILFSVHFLFFILFTGTIFVLWAFREKKIILGLFLRRAFLGIVIILLINSNWLIGALNQNSNLSDFLNQGISYGDAVAFQTQGKTNTEVVVNVAMMSGFWGKDQHRYIDLTAVKENWGKSFLLLLPIIMLGIVVSLKDKKRRLFSIGMLSFTIIESP